MSSKSKAKPAGESTVGLRVIARRDSFRRAGRVFTPEATVIPLSELSEEEANAIKDETQLIVDVVSIETPKADKA